MAKQLSRYESDGVTPAEEVYDEGTVRDGAATTVRRLWWKNTSTSAETLEACRFRRVQAGANDGLTFLQTAPDVPKGAPGAGSAAPATGGAGLEIGDYHYVITFITANGETTPGVQFDLTTTEGNQHADLSSIPTGPSGVTKRRVYRTEVGGSDLFFVAEIANNSATIYHDEIGDASLGDPAPTLNTSGSAGTWGTANITIGDMAVGDYAACWMRYNVTAGTTQVGNPRQSYVTCEEAPS